MKKYTFTYYESVWTGDEKSEVITDTKTTWESDTLDDRDTMAKYFTTLRNAYKAQGKFISIYVLKDDILALGVRIDDMNDPNHSGVYTKFMEIKVNEEE